MDENIPGYKNIIIKPRMGGGLTNAAASLQTYYGKIVSGWRKEMDKLVMDVEIPVNTSALIILPAKEADMITEGGNPLQSIKEIELAGSENGYIKLKLGSGKYHFEVMSR
jgi:alpha-L-rhamnosidase